MVASCSALSLSNAFSVFHMQTVDDAQNHKKFIKNNLGTAPPKNLDTCEGHKQHFQTNTFSTFY